MKSLAFVAFLVLLPANGLQARIRAQMPAKPCAEPEEKQFDFWEGEWDLTWPSEKPGETGHGGNSIKRIMGGCVLEERFTGGESMPLRGMSVSTFVPRAGKWKQTWVDNEGGYLDFVGEFKNRQMILSREGVAPDGAKILQRMVWKNISAKELDWSWEFSKDGGKTWQIQWPIHYKRKS